jgi:hypothetical protein
VMDLIAALTIVLGCLVLVGVTLIILHDDWEARK